MSSMPLHPCDAGHDYSEPFIERSKPGKVTIVRKVKECLGCGKKVEVFTDPSFYQSQRIKTYT